MKSGWFVHNMMLNTHRVDRLGYNLPIGVNYLDTKDVQDFWIENDAPYVGE